MAEEEIKKVALNLGADIFGVADLDLIREYKTHPRNLLDGFTRGIVIGLKLPDSIFDSLPESRPLYSRAYTISNDILDRISFKISRRIEVRGYKALPIPASKIVSGLHWMSFISHKAVARAAGVGWIGKNLLLITPTHGPRVRLSTILTDYPIEAGEPIRNRCGKCKECVESCIANALRDVAFKDYPQREDVLDVEKCASKLQEFAKNPDIGNMVCGICIKVCPWGRREADQG
jgi:epoxyqueuosine reductase QueG